MLLSMDFMYAGPIVAFAALAVGLLVAWRSRTIFAPNLKFGFGLSEVFGTDVKLATKNRSLVAIIVGEEHSGDTDRTFFVPFFVHNTSARKIGDVMLLLEYPAQYLITNREMVDRAKAIRDAFPHLAGDGYYSVESMERTRSVAVVGGKVQVTYEIGALRPDQFLGQFEVIRVPKDRGKAFSDKRYEHLMFANVLRHLSGHTAIAGLAHIRAFLFSDLTRKRRQMVDVCMVDGTSDDVMQAAVTAYGEAYWLNDFPSGRSYYNPFRAFFPVFGIPPVMQPQPVLHMVVNHEVVHLAKSETTATVITQRDPIEHGEWGAAALMMPGYDCFNLPASIDTVDAALAASGYRRLTDEERRLFPRA